MSTRAWALFAAASVIWGMPYLFIKIAVDDGLAPGFVAWSRVTLAALVLLPIAWRAGALRGLPLRWVAGFATAEIAIPFPLIGFGEQRVASSMAAILVAAMPLVVTLLAMRFPGAERPSFARLGGMLIGLAGVVALLGIDVGGRGTELAGAGAVLVAMTGYACGTLIVERKLSDVDPLGPVTAAMVLGSVMLLPFGVGDFPHAVPAGEALASLTVLGLVCSALAFLVFFRLIAAVGPGRASVVTYLNPVVALALGVAVLGEAVAAGAMAGLLLILAGSWLATDGRLPLRLAAIGKTPLLVAAPADQCQLLPARELLDPPLLTEGGRAVGRRQDERVLNRAAPLGVAACRPGLVLAQAALGVGGPAAVEAAVGAAQQVDERAHQGDVRAGTPWPSRTP